MDTTTARTAPLELPPLIPDGWVWKIALGATAVLGVAFILGAVEADWVGRVRAILCLAAMFAMAVAVYLRPTNRAILAVGFVAGLVGRWGFPADWDSGRMAITVGAILCGTAALVLGFPPRGRRIALSALMLIHFGGILSAVTSPGAQPYMSSLAGLYVYRPYLQFVYLTNAYHFYSPEPGPANMLWFCIYYENGDYRWYKFPRRPDDMTDPLALSYYRRLSLTEQVNNLVPNPTISDDVMRARMLVAQQGYPFSQDILPYGTQYRPPNDNVRVHVLPAFVRYVARAYPHVDDDARPTGKRVVSVKVYRVEHRILYPVSAMQGISPYDPSTLSPYFQGEYDADGNPINLDDPMLFWLVPIVWEPRNAGVPAWKNYLDHPQDFQLRDVLKMHSKTFHWTDRELKDMGLQVEGDFLRPIATKEGKKP